MASFYSGGTPLTSKKEYFDGNIPFIRSGEIDSDKTEQFITELGLKCSSAKLVDAGDILYALYGANSGEVAICKIHGAINQAILCIKSEENHYFIFTYLLLKKEYIIKTFLQGGQGNLSAEIIKNLEIKLPSLLEQKKIATLFSILDERIKSQKKIISKYKSLIRNLREEVLSQKLRFKNALGNYYTNWESTPLKSITQIFDGTHQTPEYQTTGIPFYSVENVTANNFSNTKFISEDIFVKENKRVKIEEGDILMTRIGDIGTARYIDWQVNASFYVSLALIKKSENYNSKYLAQYIPSKRFQNEIWNRTIHVAFPKKINLGEIGECLVLLPSIEEQTRIANFLSSIDEKAQTEKKILAQYETQKKYLLANLFV